MAEQRKAAMPTVERSQPAVKAIAVHLSRHRATVVRQPQREAITIPLRPVVAAAHTTRRQAVVVDMPAAVAVVIAVADTGNPTQQNKKG